MNVCSLYMHRASWVTLGLLKPSMLIFCIQFHSANMNWVRSYYTRYTWGEKIKLYSVHMDRVLMSKLDSHKLCKASYALPTYSTMHLEIIWYVEMKGEERGKRGRVLIRSFLLFEFDLFFRGIFFKGQISYSLFNEGQSIFRISFKENFLIKDKMYFN